MKPETKEGRLDVLFAKLVEETISGEELEELETLMDQSPKAQDRYLQYMSLHQDLEAQVPGAGWLISVSEGRRGTDADSVRFGWRWLVSAAAIVALAFVVWGQGRKGGWVRELIMSIWCDHI